MRMPRPAANLENPGLPGFSHFWGPQFAGCRLETPTGLRPLISSISQDFLARKFLGPQGFAKDRENFLARKFVLQEGTHMPPPE